MKLSFLIPAHNDAYTLRFAVDSLLETADEIVVLDDCSTDGTPDLLSDYEANHAHVKVLRNTTSQQLGWWDARNSLLAATDNRYVFFIDSDDVFAEYNSLILREIVQSKQPVVRLKLFELWGDFDHGTRCSLKTDPCHVFVDRGQVPNVEWACGGGYHGTSANVQHKGAKAGGHEGGVLFFHIKGCKPDWRLYERCQIRPWIRAGMEGRLADWAHLMETPPEVMHARAMMHLLHSRQDPIRRVYPECGPQRPAVIRNAHDRFRMVYDESNKPIDRIDLCPLST